MRHYFISTKTYQPKNSAQKELNQYIDELQHTLLDERSLSDLKEEIENQVGEINAKFPRCEDIKLMIQFYSQNEGSGIIWAEGIFNISVTKVNRIRTTDKEIYYIS